MLAASIWTSARTILYIPQVNKLNFGCGHRFAKGWINIDFHSEHPEVQRVNLLQRLPFPDNHFDVVYSSHVLEHFSPATAEALLQECHRVLKKNGILRTVLPDLEATCREYVRLLNEVEHSESARARYDWIILELLDQLTRTEPSGLILPFRNQLIASGNQELIRYIQSRTDTNPWIVPAKENVPALQGVIFVPPPTFRTRWRSLTWNKLKTKLLYFYIGFVKQLFPASLRATIVDNTYIGEKHKWMYDRHSLTALLHRCRFGDVRFLSAAESQIPNFNTDCLDIEADGRPYKCVSLFSEARKV